MKEVKPINILKAKNREELRLWLENNYETQKECWVIVKRGKPQNDDTFWYIDAVEEALCFGWIDSTVKKLDNGITIQRLSPRKKDSIWSELNKERCRRMEKLGKMTQALKDYEGLEEDGIIEKWFSKESLENKIIQMEDFKKSIKKDNKYKEVFLKDLEDKIEISKKLKEQFDFSIISKMSIMNSHGDYSVQQLIYNNEKETSVIDFESAKRLPIMWEIIRSYTYIDKDVKNGEMNIDTFIEYVREVSKYVKLNEFDLKYCAYIYLIQIIGSLYGYKQYNENYEQIELLNFAIFRTNICRYLYEHLDEIGTRLEKEVTEYMKKEKLDVLNERGEFTGIIETREECHKKGLWHRCVYAFVIDKDSNILLQKRSANKKLWPNLWDVTVGGHVDSGEFGRQALIRECKEELGIDICDKDIKYLVGSCSKTTKGKITNNQFNECYLITKNIDISKVKLQEEEVAEIKFFTKEEVLERINNNYDGLTDKTGPWNFLLKILEQR